MWGLVVLGLGERGNMRCKPPCESCIERAKVAEVLSIVGGVCVCVFNFHAAGPLEGLHIAGKVPTCRPYSIYGRSFHVHKKRALQFQ
jgi:hypothetical protein